MRTIGDDTKVRLNLVVTLLSIAFAAGVIWWKVDAVQVDLRKTWTIQHQAIWAERFASKNPSVIVPDINDVVNTMNQQH